MDHRPVQTARTVTSSNSDAHPWGESIETAIQRRLVSIDSGKYRQDMEYALWDFCSFLAGDLSVTQLEDIEIDDCQRYAEELANRLQDGDHDLESARSAHQRFDLIHAWLGWCEENTDLQSNPAKPDRAREPIPSPTQRKSTQFWSERDRDVICATADAYVDASLDGSDIERPVAYRDRAFVYVLAWSGCRGAELLNHPDDDARSGLAWRDVDLDRGVLEVFGKAREWQNAPLFEQAIEPLRRWRRECPATDDEDAVFPRLDNAAKGMDERPAMTTKSGRDVLSRLCEWSDYEFDEVLKPHGARRGLGHTFYMESAEVAQKILRHQDLETTNQAYDDHQAAEVREIGQSILSENDSNE